MKPAAPLLVLLLCAGAAGAQDFPDCHLAPGWEPSGPVRQYNADNLYEYKDGGAEGYLIFGFAGMRSIDCKSGKNTLTIDVSQMSGPDEAYGILAANLDPARPVAEIGMGGQVQPQSAIFAKGSYYVEIVENAADAASDDTATLRALADALEVRLKGSSVPPAQIRWFLPGTAAPVRMVPESVLGLRELKRGYVAKYAQGQAFIVLDATPQSAALTLKTLRARFTGAVAAEAGEEGFQAQAQYLGGLCIFRKGRVLAGFVNLPAPQQAAEKAAALAARIP